MRPIDADALKRFIDCGHLRHPAEKCFSELDVIRMLDRQPTIDYVPDLQGEWIHDINNLYGCSVCLSRETMSPKRMKKYCSTCGARMYRVESDG